MLLVLQRVAGLFNVNLELNGLRDDNRTSEAAFAGDPDFRDDVAAASKAATSELSASVQDILKPGAEAPRRRRRGSRCSPRRVGRAAYAALYLDDLGRAIRATAAAIQRQEEGVEAQHAEVAGRTKVDAKSLRELLVAARNDPSSKLPEAPSWPT